MRRIAVAMCCGLLPFALGSRSALGQTLSTRGQCEAPELLGSHREYNQLVCDGVEAMQAGRYLDAVRRFEQGLDITLFEFPNFMLLPRLALAYSKAGRAKEARQTVEEARIALSVLTGLYACSYTADGSNFQIRDRYGNVLTSPEAEHAKTRMCGEMYEPIYTDRSLEDIFYDAKLIEVYLNAKSEILEAR